MAQCVPCDNFIPKRDRGPLMRRCATCGSHLDEHAASGAVHKSYSSRFSRAKSKAAAEAGAKAGETAQGNNVPSVEESLQHETKQETVYKQPYTVLNDGSKIPMLGFGTFLCEKGEVGQAVKWAIKAGYRHIDCAAIYGNEEEVGEAFEEIFSDKKTYGVDRSEVFITSKLWLSDMAPHAVRDACETSLRKLKLKYLDLYLIHVPFPKVPGKSPVGFGLQDTWREMERLVELRLTKSIGVSNYNTLLLADCLNYAKIPPAVNQVERHPKWSNPKGTKWAQEQGVHIQAYAPLGAPGLQKTSLMDDPVVKAIAAKHKKTPAQVLIRWQVDQGIIVLAKSVKQHRIQENLNVSDFSLTKQDIDALFGLDTSSCGRLFTQEDHCSGFFW